MTEDRCPWAAESDLMEAYHDEEWGVPLHEDNRLFELLVLEGSQAGLSWSLILQKRDGYRRAFASFDLEQVAAFTDRDLNRLLADPGIVRNRAKVRAAVENARRAQEVRSAFGSLDAYLWRFVGGRPIQHAFSRLEDIPSETPESRRMSADMKGRGFAFVGPTVCYAFMQAVGMVNDHLVACPRHGEIQALSGSHDADLKRRPG